MPLIPILLLCFPYDLQSQDDFFFDDFECKKINKELATLDSHCEKLERIDLAIAEGCSQECFLDFFYEIGRLTMHKPNVFMGFDGIYYEDDTLWMDDMLVWKNILGCMAEVDLGFRVLTYKEESTDSVIQIQFGPFGHYSKQNKNNYLFTNPQRTDGSFIDPKVDSTEMYALSVFALKKICLLDDTIKKVWHPTNLLFPIFPGGIDLRSAIGDTCYIYGLGDWVLEEKGNWGNDSNYLIFHSTGEIYPYRRFMYVHNVGFLWEELHYTSKSYRWVLEAIDGEPVLDFLRQNPDYSFLKK